MIAILRFVCAAGFLAAIGLCSTFEGVFARTSDCAEEFEANLFQDPGDKDAAKKTDPSKNGAKKEDAAKKEDDPKKTDPGKDTPKKDGDPKKTDPGKDTPKKDGDPKKTDGTKKGSSTSDLLNKSGKKGQEKTEAQKSPYVVMHKSLLAEVAGFDQTSGVLNLKVRQYAVVPSISGSGRNAQIKGELKTKDHEVKAILTDDVKIRVLNPPPLYDDKGRMKRYTAKELKELKGEDTKTPGYPADSADLQPRARIQVDLVLKKEDYARLKSRKKSEEPLPEVLSTNLIIVVAPPPPSP